MQTNKTILIFMKLETRKIGLALIPGLLFIFIIYMVKIVEIGMEIDLGHLGVYPLQAKGISGIFLHPLIHSNIKHLFANTIPLLFLLWCLFYFYKDISLPILGTIWLGCGILTFIIGKPAWHIGASGIIYGLAFFLFFSGLLRKYIPLMAISLLVTFLYGGIVWQMFPQFTASNVSWEGHLSGAASGTFCALAYLRYGPQKPIIVDEEEDEENFYYLEEDTAVIEKESSQQERDTTVI